MAEIIERENGPLIVKGLAPMTGTDGAPVEIKPVRALCRCGHSKNKPFCDNSHVEAGFQSRGGKPAGRDRLIAYEGADVTVYFNPRVCSHAAECGRLAVHIFDDKKRPWVQPDEGTVDQVEAVITACPSGALTMSETSGVPQHRVGDRAQIEVQKNGPYWVTGIALPTGLQGEAMSDQKYVLCRCGLSGNKPYCDGSHRDAGWRDVD